METTNPNSMVRHILQKLDSKPPASCKIEIIDFPKVGLKDYAGSFAMLVHDALSPEECRLLLEAVENGANNKWDQALVNVGLGQQALLTDTRLCDRILWDDHDVAGRILNRVLPHLPDDIVTLKNRPEITGRGPMRRKETWRISRLNERLRFLKYTSGMYFRPHFDGSYVTPDNIEITFLTLHLYLNGGDESEIAWRKSNGDDSRPLIGGATRFFGMREDDKWDVSPKTGSILVFQHKDLFHSGEDVLQGTKYTMRSDILYRKVEE